MELDLSLLHSNTVEEIVVKDSYELDKEYYQDSEVRDLSKIAVNGRIIRKADSDNQLNDYFEGTISGEMIIGDSVTLEDVSYPFTITYDDFLPENSLKSENILDIFEFLWENIVLEVPLQFTKVRDLSKFHGDGWKLISEEDRNHEANPFSELLKEFDKE